MQNLGGGVSIFFQVRWFGRYERTMKKKIHSAFLTHFEKNQNAL